MAAEDVDDGKNDLEPLFLQTIQEYESSFHMAENRHGDPLVGDCMLLDSCSMTNIFSKGGRKPLKNLH